MGTNNIIIVINNNLILFTKQYLTIFSSCHRVVIKWLYLRTYIVVYWYIYIDYAQTVYKLIYSKVVFPPHTRSCKSFPVIGWLD